MKLLKQAMILTLSAVLMLSMAYSVEGNDKEKEDT